MTKRVFYVSGGRLSAYNWESNGVSDPIRFDADERGFMEFSRYLENVPNDPVYVLADFVEEEFREETIPHVFGSDRRALIATKLNRLFRETTYSHAQFQGRVASGRRDDRVLFTALIRPDLLAPWLRNMSDHRVPVAGIYSVALITGLLFKALKIDNPHSLVVTQQTGGLRQTYFLDGQLKISRLAILSGLGSDRYASFLLTEVEKIRRYLTSLRSLPHDSPLNVHVLGEAKQLQDIERLSPDSLTTRHNLIPVEEAARAVGIKRLTESKHAEQIFVHLLAKNAPPNQYAPVAETRYYSLHQTRAGLHAASILLLIASIGWSGLKFVEAIVATEEAESAKRQTVFYNERYKVAKAHLPKTPVESRQIKLAVEIADRLNTYKTDPEKMMVTLSRVLTRYPQLRLERMAWRAGTDANALVGDAARPPAGTRAPFAPVAATAPVEEKQKLYHLALIKGRIMPFDGNYRRALDLINGFAEEIRMQPGVVNVRIHALPLELGSDSKLQGDAVGSAMVRDADFELHVALEDRHGEAG